MAIASRIPRVGRACKLVAARVRERVANSKTKYNLYADGYAQALDDIRLMLSGVQPTTRGYWDIEELKINVQEGTLYHLSSPWSPNRQFCGKSGGEYVAKWSDMPPDGEPCVRCVKKMNKVQYKETCPQHLIDQARALRRVD